jgi:hypothetical protein
MPTKTVKFSSKRSSKVTPKRRTTLRPKIVAKTRGQGGDRQQEKTAMREAVVYEVMEIATYADPVLLSEEEIQKFGT